MDLERRIQTLEDIEEIRKLKAAYCAACDDDHNGDAVADLFVEHGTWGAAGQPPEVGKAQIAAFMYGVRNRGHMKRSAHQVFNPVIKIGGDGVAGDGVAGDGVAGDGVAGDGVAGDGVVGDRATGDWRFLMMYTSTDEQSFVRIIGTYHDTYVRTSTGWKFGSLEVTIEERGVYATASP